MRKLPANSHSSAPTATAPVVDSTPSPAVMEVVDAEIEGRCAVGPQIIRHHSLGNDGAWLGASLAQFSIENRGHCQASPGWGVRKKMSTRYLPA